MFVKNLCSPQSGKPVANQFIIEGCDKVVFQSYETTIATIDNKNMVLEVGEKWDYSNTTLKYFKEFLLEYGLINSLLSKKELQKLLDSGKIGNYSVVI